MEQAKAGKLNRIASASMVVMDDEYLDLITAPFLFAQTGQENTWPYYHQFRDLSQLPGISFINQKNLPNHRSKESLA
jgi:hypothetical protein